MKDLQTNELTGTSFGYVDTILYCCSSVKIDDENFLFPNFSKLAIPQKILVNN